MRISSRGLLGLLALIVIAGCSSDEPEDVTPALIAYVEWTPDVDTSRVITMLPDGSDRQVHYAGAQNEEIDRLVPSPDGERLLFRSFAGADYEWHQLTMPEGDVQPYDAPPDVSEVVWSPRGNRLAWYVYSGNGWIGLTQPGGTAIRRITPTEDFVVPVPPVWSPDGSRLVVTRQTWGGDFDLYIATTAGAVTPLVVGDRLDASPDWSGATDLIAFVRETGMNDSAGIYVVRPDGSGLRQVTSGNYGAVFWAPDGRTIAALRGNGVRWEVVNVNVETGAVAQLAPSPAFTSSWAMPWSPDGQQLLYGTWGTASFPVLMLRELDGGSAQLTPSSLIVEQAVWLP